jgi:hypothetical protein
MWTDIDTLNLMVAYRNFAKEPVKGGGEILPSTSTDLNTCDLYLRVMLKAKLCSKSPRTGDSSSLTNKRQCAVNVFVRWSVSAVQKKIFSCAFFQGTLHGQGLLAWSCLSLCVCPSA